MTTRTEADAPERLPAELIDASRTISFTFEGKRYQAHPGDTIASALAAAGVKVFSRSFKYHRPRGLMCCAGHCPNCLVQVGREPSVRSCTRPVEEGMVVKAQNVRGSLNRDLMSVTQLGDSFLPVGFYYKAFVHPQAAWPAYEKVLRAMSGLGKIDPDTPPGDYFKEYLHADVAVVGAGPAGLSAALAAAEAGARVALFDDNAYLGGHLRYAPPARQGALDVLVEAVEANELITVYTKTTVLGWYEDNWLAAVTPREDGGVLYKIRAASVVVAAGAYEQPVVFDNNDLPGVMLGSGIQRLLHLYGVAPGRRAVVFAANAHAWEVAADLRAAGVEIAAVADIRPNASQAPEAAPLVRDGVPVYWGQAVFAAEGSGKVEAAIIAPVGASGEASGVSQRVPCDLVVVCANWSPANGLLYQAGATIAYDEARGEFLPRSLPPGVYAAGRVMGTRTPANEVLEGRRAGLEAAASAGYAVPPAPAETPAGSEPPAGTNLTRIKGNHKRFVCFCEDVTDKDIDMAIGEGFNSIELLKRYSTISMGPCQGKMCSQNTIHLCARANGWSVDQTGTTTSRPPTTPVELGVLAGQNMEPVQITPVHAWHLARGAKMMIAGLWLRPEHYGDSLREIRVVREGVGLIDVSTLGKLKLTGPGVPALLDRLYINQWRNLAVGRARYGIMCNDEGVILDDGVTARAGEQEWYMTTTSSGAGAIFEWIQWWVQSGWGDGVHVANVTEGRAAFNLAGPKARQVLQRLTAADISNAAFPYMRVREIDLCGVACRVLRIGFTGELSYEIHCPAGAALQIWEAIIEAGAADGILPFGVEAQRVLRLEKAHIIVGQDTDGLTDPIAADMNWAVKLDKADFLGQRALTKISADGPKQRLVGFKMAAPGYVPEEGLQIVEPNPVHGRWEIAGWVTSSRFSPTLNETIGLCWLPAETAAREGAEFTIRVGNKLKKARVHHGPFYDPAGDRLRM